MLPLFRVASILGIFASTVFSQGVPVPFVIRDDVNLVLVDAAVRDSRGTYISGLSRSQFRVLDSGHPQPITQFASTDVPVTVGLVIDNSGSMRSKRPEVVRAGLEFARTSNKRDEFFVVNFNNRVYSGLPSGMEFTDQLQVLRSALYFGEPVGQTALYDAVALALKRLEDGHHDTRTLIVVSDGGDNASKLPFNTLMSLIEASRATVYCIGLLDPLDRDLNPRVLRKISSVSGGELFIPTALDEVPEIFEKISRDIRNRYVIGFVPPPSDGKHNVHAIKISAVAANGTKLSVRARTAYLSPGAERPN